MLENSFVIGTGLYVVYRPMLITKLNSGADENLVYPIVEIRSPKKGNQRLPRNFVSYVAFAATYAAA